MRPWQLTAALVGIGSVALLPLSAAAGDWGCGRCSVGYSSPGPVYYAPPTYTYAPPTVTIVPRIVVQPNYVIERTYLSRPTHYVREAAPCWFACEQGFRVVNQGQYPAVSNFDEYPALSEQSWSGESVYVTSPRVASPSYYMAPRDYRYQYRRARQATVWRHRHKPVVSTYRHYQYHHRW